MILTNTPPGCLFFQGKPRLVGLIAQHPCIMAEVTPPLYGIGHRTDDGGLSCTFHPPPPPYLRVTSGLVFRPHVHTSS